MDDETRLEVTRTAVADVMADWLRHGGAQADVHVWLDADGEVCIWVDGGGTTPSAQGAGPAELAASAAEHVHAELMDDTAHVAPACPDHRCGLHPTATDDGPAWHCTVGRHTVGRVGALPPPGSGSAPHRR